MLLFAHAGIPLGVAWLSSKAIVRAGRTSTLSAISSPAGDSAPRRSDFGFATKGLDYRLLLLGSILPDIIDKPVGTLLFRDSLGNGRVFGHTLLLAILLVTIGAYLYVRHRMVSLVSFPLGCFAHLCLDEMWIFPRTLLWPLYGWTFDKMGTRNWLEEILTSLRTDPSVFIPELIGVLLLLAFLLSLIKRGEFVHFLRSGEAE